MKTQLNILKLVYPPISNQEAEWLKSDSDVQKVMKESNLYMICQRAESRFEIEYEKVLSHMEHKFGIRFKYEIESHKSNGEINLYTLVKLHNFNMQTHRMDIEIGDKLIRLLSYDLESGQKKGVIDWFTTEKILYDKWRGHPAVEGLEDYKRFTDYFLHYVGISKSDDSLTRLVIKPHDKRLRVLSHENTQRYGARLTDEMILLFFRIEPIRVNFVTSGNEINDLDLSDDIDFTPVIADAEKAFVKILNSEYNTIKYKNYPKGTDGLRNSGLSRYGYIIGEDMTLTTNTAQIVGSHISETCWGNDADLIFIDGDNVSLEKYQ